MVNLLFTGASIIIQLNEGKSMRILVYGAGAIGSIFAGKLIKVGFDITVLARNERFKELSSRGLILRNAITGTLETYYPKLINDLAPNDIYDYIIVTVQYTQIDSLLPALSKNKSKNIVFVVNNPSGYKKYIDAVGYERILIGFPSAGGERINGMVNYFIGTGVSKLFQSTTFGELNGKKTQRLLNLIKIFKKAGFAPEICSNMDAWQKTHIAVVTPIAKALYKFDSDNYKLAQSYKTIKMMILATRECFKVLKALQIHITPFKLNFYYLPTFIIVPIYMIIMNTKIAEFAMAKHTIVAKDEMIALENDFKKYIHDSNIDTPALRWLD